MIKIKSADEFEKVSEIGRLLALRVGDDMGHVLWPIMHKVFSAMHEWEISLESAKEEREMKIVTKEQFRDFIDSYPSPLKDTIVHIGELPEQQWNDLTLGRWPLSVVATMSLEQNCTYRVKAKEAKP